MMEGEKFLISLTTNAKPFFINTLRSIPFIYLDKLKSQPDLLLSQEVITPVTEATMCCPPLLAFNCQQMGTKLMNQSLMQSLIVQPQPATLICFYLMAKKSIIQ